VATNHDGGEAIMEAFRSLGIEHIMSSPGSEWSPVWEALARQKTGNRPGPDFIECWHETLAVNMAMGYTQYTGKMQAVLLHAGVGLMQGEIGIHTARNFEIPMVVMSGEALTYGEDPSVEPGAQWYGSLGIVGGPQRIVEPVTKWATRAPGNLAVRARLRPCQRQTMDRTTEQPWRTRPSRRARLRHRRSRPLPRMPWSWDRTE